MQVIPLAKSKSFLDVLYIHVMSIFVTMLGYLGTIQYEFVQVASSFRQQL